MAAVITVKKLIVMVMGIDELRKDLFNRYCKAIKINKPVEIEGYIISSPIHGFNGTSGEIINPQTNTRLFRYDTMTEFAQEVQRLETLQN